MTRVEVEDAILAALRQALPNGVSIDALPLGLHDRLALDVRKNGAVWVVYAGSTRRGDNNPNSRMQAETWTWMVIPLAKEYRSPAKGAVSGLALLETINASLPGLRINGQTLTRQQDQLANLPEGSGVMGYEILFTINAFAPCGQ